MTVTRQTTLGIEPASPYANDRVLRKPLLSATTLAAWWVCRTRPFLQRVLERLGVDTSTAAMRAGSRAHAQVQEAIEAVAPASDETLPQALARGSFLIQNELHLIDEHRRLHGYADIVYARGGRLHILELKNSRPPDQYDPVWRAPVRREHGVQVHTYGAIAHATFGTTPRLFLSYMRGGSKDAALVEIATSRDPAAAIRELERSSIELESSPAARSLILEQATDFFRAETQPLAPPPDHADPRTCHYCSVKSFCSQRLDKPGEFTALDPSKLLDPA